jgi:hypothetical protein
MKTPLKLLGSWLLLTLVSTILFSLGGALFPPVEPFSFTPAEQAESLRGMVLMSAIDAALLLLLVRTSRLSGLRLMLLTAGAYYFVKTVTSQIEAVYFMPNVTGPMLPALLAMTLPATLGLAPLAVLLGGRLRRSALDETPGLAPLPMGKGEAWLKVGVLSALVYPALFFLAGWFIAFRSDALGAFYGGPQGPTFFSHLAVVFSKDPFIPVLEMLRGALWVGCAYLILQSTKGPWWLGALQVALWFALLQNDVHLLPNPLMTAEIRLFHFLETGSSNFLFGLCIGWLLSRSHASRVEPLSPPLDHSPGHSAGHSAR